MRGPKVDGGGVPEYGKRQRQPLLDKGVGMRRAAASHPSVGVGKGGRQRPELGKGATPGPGEGSTRRRLIPRRTWSENGDPGVTNPAHVCP
uniref:Uncharacterized protein n=1 Tax=Arundo donax TaxID=35708 RepID=A0A0A9AKD2_ARUDO